MTKMYPIDHTAHAHPLGVNCHLLTETTEQKLRLIESFDLAVQKQRIIKKGLVAPDQIDLVELELKRFLALPILFVGPSNYGFAPPQVVDHLWHEIILFTSDYRRFCDAVYGRYLDHAPNQSSAETLALVGSGDVEYTKDKMLEAFCKLEPVIWTEHSDCCGCRGCTQQCRGHFNN